MPFYEVITPLETGRGEAIAPGEIVELSKREGDALVEIGALSKSTRKPAREAQNG